MNQQDPRVVFTQTMIKNALLELIKENDLSKVTINQICETAGVNRSTFYRYYTSVYDLWNNIEQDYFRDIVLKLGIRESEQSNTLLYKLLGIIKENPILNRSVSNHVNSKLPKMVTGYYKDKIIVFWKKNNPDFSEEHLEYLFAAYVGALTSVIRRWINNGMKDSEEEIVKIMCEISFLGLYK